jgi:hypothetical protein
MPKGYGRAITYVASGNIPENCAQPLYILPPERANLPGGVQHLVGIILAPNEIDPGNINFAIELVEMFEKESIFLHLQIDDSQTPFPLWFSNHWPSSQVPSFFPRVIASPQTLFACSINVVNHADR